MLKRKLLLISNSQQYNQSYLVHALEPIRDFIGGNVNEILFVPLAAITISYDDYAERVRNAFSKIGLKVTSLHETDDPIKAISNAQALVVGGGNTFKLLNELYELKLINSIKDFVSRGAPFIGWSAGANIACPTIMTTNDMPVVWPKVMTALNFIPFQINPHFIDQVPPEFCGETRDARIAKFTAFHENVYVVGLREGAILAVEGSSVILKGISSAKVFLNSLAPVEHDPGKSLDFLLNDFHSYFWCAFLYYSPISADDTRAMIYSTVTDLARFLGWSTSVPFKIAT